MKDHDYKIKKVDSFWGHEVDTNMLNEKVVKTKDGSGGMRLKPTLFMRQWLEYASTHVNGDGMITVCDVGAAYGVATIGALIKDNHIYVVAIDPVEQHLEKLNDKIREVGEKWGSRSLILHGKVPGVIEPGTTPAWDAISNIAAFLFAACLQFIQGKDIRLTLRIAYEKLAIGGAVFIQTASPYLPVLRARGYPEIYKDGLERGYTFSDEIGKIQGLPEIFLNVFTPETLTRLLSAAGFDTIEVGYRDINDPRIYAKALKSSIPRLIPDELVDDNKGENELPVFLG